MLSRSAAKVKGSADAAEFLHSDVVLHEGDEPRGWVLLRKEGEEIQQGRGACISCFRISSKAALATRNVPKCAPSWRL